MPDYRRYRVAGGTYFFTVNLLQRYPNDLLVRPIELLRTGVRDVRATWPFHIDAWVCYRIIGIVGGPYRLRTLILRTAGG
jgi:REP element-mobilizing transposase RayT